MCRIDEWFETFRCGKSASLYYPCTLASTEEIIKLSFYWMRFGLAVSDSGISRWYRYFPWLYDSTFSTVIILKYLARCQAMWNTVNMFLVMLFTVFTGCWIVADNFESASQTRPDQRRQHWGIMMKSYCMCTVCGVGHGKVNGCYVCVDFCFLSEQQQRGGGGGGGGGGTCSTHEEASGKTTTAQDTQGLWIPLTLDKVSSTSLFD